jgi:hypothetical protein
MSIPKSIPNLISYLHKFSWIFILFLSIFPREKPILGFILNGKTCHRWGPPGSGSVATRRVLISRCWTYAGGDDVMNKNSRTRIKSQVEASVCAAMKL